MNRVWRAEEFADRARDCVPNKEDASDEPWAFEAQHRVGDEPQQYEHHQPFEHGFIELARGARECSAIREYHADGCFGWAAPMLGVDKVGDAAKEQPERHGSTAQIHDGSRRYFE